MIEAPVSVMLMSADEARACVDRIRAGMEDVRAAVLDLYDREGWRSLGYDSWRHCIAVEFSMSVSRAYQLLDAARVDQMLSTDVESAPIPEAHARELARLKDDPAAVREVWSELQESSERITAGTTERAVDKRLGVERTTPQPATPEHDEPPLSTEPPVNKQEMWLLIADLAGFIRDQVTTRLVTVGGVVTRHDRHCTFTAEHQVCSRKCQLARSLIERAEMVG